MFTEEKLLEKQTYFFREILTNFVGFRERKKRRYNRSKIIQAEMNKEQKKTIFF